MQRRQQRARLFRPTFHIRHTEQKKNETPELIDLRALVPHITQG
jgi:hypothetical protein